MQPSTHDLTPLGLHDAIQHWNLPAAALIEAALRKGEGRMTSQGAFLAVTAPTTGRSPQDRFVVDHPQIHDDIWWGAVNKPISQQHYEVLRADVLAYLQSRELYVRDMYAGADPRERVNVRLVTESAWHNLFAANMFIQPDHDALRTLLPDFTVLHAPNMQTIPARHGTRSDVAVLIHFVEREILIIGTKYAGEIKKSIFGVMNYLLPKHGLLSMHCSANIGDEGDTAVFFGLSGTGKTTLSADPSRGLIGDDEHGWAEEGVFNFEGGCYAKVINLSAEAEPEIHATLGMFGTILENVVMDPVTREVDLDDDTITENTRGSYPISFIPHHVPNGRGGHPKNIFFLTADAFGVLPPISRLTPEQAMYHFISGYTAKLAGTERGVTEPSATFSACFGAPFLAWHPIKYAELLAENMPKHAANVWLVNTGWTGGPYGVGHRMSIKHTRALIHAALEQKLEKIATTPHPVFGVHMPVSCPDVPQEVLNPRNTWADPAAYDAQAQKLAELFVKNFAQFADRVPAEVIAAGPLATTRA